MSNKKYKLWEVIKPLEHNIDFKLFEQKILLFKEMKEQGIVNENVTKALNDNKFNISANFKGKNKQHNIVIKDVFVTDISQSNILSDIEVSDVLIDDVSVFSNNNNLGMVL